MPVLSCYVDDRTLAILQREAQASGRTVEQLAEAAIESEAIASLPGGYPGGGQHFPDSLAGQPFHHGLAPSDADRLKAWIGEERLRDDPMLGRESSIRPGYFEGDME